MLGSQHPRISHVPEYVSSSGEEATRLAALGGLNLDPWQQLVLTHSLGERAGGKWAAFQVGLVVGRQNGKDAVLEARELAELYIVAQEAGPRLIIHSAHLFSTSLEHFKRLSARIKESPELRRRVKHRGARMTGIRESHGEESIELEDGSRILFAARTKGGRRGFSADLLIWNESMDLPDAVVGAVMPTVSARTGPEFLPGPQVWYAGSAVNQQTMPHGVQLARVREHGIEGDDPSLAYFEWSAPDDGDPGDETAWALANPGLGIRITTDYIQAERRAMPIAEFATERMGQGDWPPTSEDALRVIPREAWQALADPASRIAQSHVFAIDVDRGQAWATLAAAGEREDGLHHVGVVEHERGTGWLVEACKRWLERFPEARLVVDPRDDLGLLLSELEAEGIHAVRTSAGDYKDACGAFFQEVVDRRLRYKPPQPELDSAVSGAATKPLLDGWKWAPGTGAVLTPLIACTLALWGCRTQGAPQVWSMAEIAERLRSEPQDAPQDQPHDAPPVGVGAGFIPLEDAPVGRGGPFRP